MPQLMRTIMQGFDRSYLKYINNKRTCHLLRNPDYIDGKAYSVEEFVEYCKPFLDEPCRFYQDFSYQEALCIRDGRHPLDNSDPKVPFRSMLFDSPLKTEWDENNLVPFKWFSDSEACSETILLFAPGWGRPCQNFEEKWCYFLQKNGVDVGLMTVPYHQARTPNGSFSGEYWISANMLWTADNFRHFTAEIRLLIQYMRQHYKRVGLIGMSSGGFQAALAANCEEVDFFFPMITGGEVGSITWHGLITQYVRQDLERKGVTEQDLRDVWAISDETVLGRHCKAKYIKQYIALYDEVVPTQYHVSMWEALGRPDRMNLPCAHYSVYFFWKKIMRDIVRSVNS